MKQEIISAILKNTLANPINGLSPAVQDQYNSLVTYLLKPSVNPKDLGLTYATIKYWEAKNYLILPLIKEADEWRKYTILEALWFNLLKHTADIGFSLEKIAPQLLFAYSNYTSPNSKTLFSAKVPPVAVVNGIRISPFINFLNHAILIILGKAKSSINLNAEGVSFIMDKGDHLAIAATAYESQFISGINICVSDLIFGLVLGSKPTLNQHTLFSDAEMAIFSELKNNSVNEITIKQSKGTIYQMQTVKNLGVKDASSPVSSFVRQANQTVEVKANDNPKHVSVRVTTKTNFKK